MDPVKELTPEDRMTWGTCPICKAEHGDKCSPDYGIPLGCNINGLPPEDIVHLARLQRAPFRVRLVPVP